MKTNACRVKTYESIPHSIHRALLIVLLIAISHSAGYCSRDTSNEVKLGPPIHSTTHWTSQSEVVRTESRIDLWIPAESDSSTATFGFDPIWFGDHCESSTAYSIPWHDGYAIPGASVLGRNIPTNFTDFLTAEYQHAAIRGHDSIEVSLSKLDVGIYLIALSCLSQNEDFISQDVFLTALTVGQLRASTETLPSAGLLSKGTQPEISVAWSPRIASSRSIVLIDATTNSPVSIDARVHQGQAEITLSPSTTLIPEHAYSLLASSFTDSFQKGLPDDADYQVLLEFEIPEISIEFHDPAERLWITPNGTIPIATAVASDDIVKAYTLNEGQVIELAVKELERTQLSDEVDSVSLEVVLDEMTFNAVKELDPFTSDGVHAIDIALIPSEGYVDPLEGNDELTPAPIPSPGAIMGRLLEAFWGLFNPRIYNVYVQDIDTEDEIIDQVCLDTEWHVNSVRGRFPEFSSTWSDWLPSTSITFEENYVARGMRRVCVRHINLPSGVRDPESFQVELQVRNFLGNLSTIYSDESSMAVCQRTPLRHIALDGKAADLTTDLRGYPHIVSSSRRGLRYHFWNGIEWVEEWIDCLNGEAPGVDGCQEADWGHDYGIQSGITLDFEMRPMVCYVKGGRPSLTEPVFGDSNDYNEPALPITDQPATAYLAYRKEIAGTTVWETMQLSDINMARMYGCSIDGIKGDDAYVASWSYYEPYWDMLWPRISLLHGPRGFAPLGGDLTLLATLEMPKVFSGPSGAQGISCSTDAECGYNTCTGTVSRSCYVLEATSDYSANFTSIVGGKKLRDEATYGFHAFMAFDMAVGRVYYSRIDINYDTSDSVLCPPWPLPMNPECFDASWQIQGVNLTHVDSLRSPRNYGLRPELAIKERGDTDEERVEAMAFSAWRNAPGEDIIRYGWAPTVISRNWDSSQWNTYIHEDLISLHLSGDPSAPVERLWTPTERHDNIGLPQWVGFTDVDLELKHMFSLEGSLVKDPTDLVYGTAPVRALYLASWDSGYSSFHYKLIDGVVLAHNGLQATLSAGDTVRAVFQNALTPMALGNPRPEGGSEDCDLEIYGTGNYWEEESGVAFGSDAWGSPNDDCIDHPEDCEDRIEPASPVSPEVIAICKDSKLYKAMGEAIVTQDELMLTPSMDDSILDMAAASTDDDKLLAFRAFMDTMGSFYDMETSCEEDMSEDSEIVLARQAHRIASLMATFEEGGKFPSDNYDETFPPPELLHEVQVDVPPNSSILETLWGTKRIKNMSSVLSEQSYVCVNDGSTRNLDSLQVEAVATGDFPATYVSSRVLDLPTYFGFRDAPDPDQRRGLDDSLESFQAWCSIAASGPFQQDLDDPSHGNPPATITSTFDLGGGDFECRGCSGDSIIDETGNCKGCRDGRIAYRGGVNVCVEWDRPSISPSGEEPVPYQFDGYAGIWHGCPSGNSMAGLEPTIPIRCGMDMQCQEVHEDWKCHGGICTEVVSCTTDLDCGEGFVCDSGGPYGVSGNVCRLENICDALVCGACLAEGPCVGVECEKYYTDCPDDWTARGGGCSCSSCSMGMSSGCQSSDHLQFHSHRYKCIEKSAISCPDLKFCNPESSSPCPFGSDCSTSGFTNWCPAREMFLDPRTDDFFSVNDIVLISTIEGDSCLYSSMGAIMPYLATNEIEAMLILMESFTYIPRFSDAISWTEDFSSPQIILRALNITDEVPLQGELVYRIGQGEDFFVDGPGGCNFRLDGPWVMEISVQPYYYKSEIYWTISRAHFINPDTNERREFSGDCDSTCDFGVSGELNKMLDGMEDPLSDQIQALTDNVWRVVADEPATAALVFGNYALLEALDYPIDDDTEPFPDRDEVVILRIEDEQSIVMALER